MKNPLVPLRFHVFYIKNRTDITNSAQSAYDIKIYFTLSSFFHTFAPKFLFGQQDMKITEALFAGSSTRISERPKQKFPEFAFIGRSNVGKSSLINMLCNNRKLAMTSSTPGKTRLVNHFLINRQWYLVDLPGYGYAKMSMSGRQKLAQMIRHYINLSPDLTMLFVLIDSRHDIGKTDMDFLMELGEARIPFGIIFTKGDKLGPVALQNKIEKNRQMILEHWEEMPPYFVSSAESGLGKEEILGYIGSVLDNLNGTDK